MEIILLERVEKLGLMGDKVTVKPGFARNYLLPKKMALRATKENIAYFETQKNHLEADNLKHRKEAEKVGAKMQKLELIMIRQAGEGDQLYGSVSANDIMKSLSEQGFTVNRNQIVLDNPIKMLGLYQARINLHPEVSVEISLNVAKSEEEAKAQKEAALAEAAAPAAEEKAEEKPKAEKKKAKEVAPEEEPKAEKKKAKEVAPEEKPKAEKKKAKEVAPEEKPKAEKKKAKEVASEEKPKAKKKTAPEKGAEKPSK